MKWRTLVFITLVYLTGAIHGITHEWRQGLFSTAENIVVSGMLGVVYYLFGCLAVRSEREQ